MKAATIRAVIRRDFTLALRNSWPRIGPLDSMSVLAHSCSAENDKQRAEVLWSVALKCETCGGSISQSQTLFIQGLPVKLTFCCCVFSQDFPADTLQESSQKQQENWEIRLGQMIMGFIYIVQLPRPTLILIYRNKIQDENLWSKGRMLSGIDP